MTTKEEAREVFLAQGDDDACSLCFSVLLVWPWDHARLRRAAEMGFAFAQAELARRGAGTDEEQFSVYLRAALLGSMTASRERKRRKSESLFIRAIAGETLLCLG